MSIDAVTISKAAKYNLRLYRFYDLPNEELQNDILTFVGTNLGGATTANDAALEVTAVDGNVLQQMMEV